MLTRARALTLIAVLEILSWITSSQNWFEISMAPNDETVVLQSFDGLTSYGFIGPILAVTLAAFSVALLTNGKSRILVFALGAAFTVGLAAFATISVLEQNLNGVAKQIEAATGIAATHGITGLATQTLPGAFLAIGSYILLALGFVVAAVSSGSWNQKSISKEAASSSKPVAEKQAKHPAKRSGDPISLWDEQR